MKRYHEDDPASASEISTTIHTHTVSGTSRDAKQSRKSKSNSVQACTSCRKHKTRCDILDGVDQPIIRCYRCKVLKVQCSYQGMSRSILEAALGAKSDSSDADGREISDTGTRPYSPFTSATPGSLSSTILFLSHPHQIWNWLDLPKGTVDWSAPLEAIQGLTNQVLGKDPSQPSVPELSMLPTIPNDSLEAILSPDQIEYMVSIFEHNYMPWLNFSLIRERRSPLLDLVCCTIASRHLEEAGRFVVAARLQTLTRENVAKMIMQSRRSETLEYIQCLLILSLWAPVCGSSEDSQDGRLLITSAVAMALDMRLNQSCEVVISLQKALSKREGVSDHKMFDAVNKARLWIALTNAESLLCIGSGRKPLSKRSAAYREMFLLSSDLPGQDLISVRDTRLRLLAEIFDIVEAGVAIRLDSLSDDDSWYDGFATVLSRLDLLSRLLDPLPVVTEFDEFYFQTLHIVERTCRSLILYHACFTVRQYFVCSGKDHALWPDQIRPHGWNTLLIWSKEAVAISESVIISFLESDTSLLGTMPDYMFNMIAFVSTYIIGVKSFVTQGVGAEISGSMEKLLERSINKLNQCSLSPDSAAIKCSTVICGMVSLWENKMAQQKAGESESPASGTSTDPSFRCNGLPGGNGSQTTTPTSDESQPSLRDGYSSFRYYGSRPDGDIECISRPAVDW